MTHNTYQIMELLIAWSNGDCDALNHLAPLIQADLRGLAKNYLARERPGHIMQPSDLIQETYVRLINWRNVRWQNQSHFFGVATLIMRHVLVNYAEGQKSLKRGGKMPHLRLEDAAGVFSKPNPDLVELNIALDRLAASHSRQSRVVEMRFFGGLTLKEIAAVLGVSVKTVKHDLALAKLWLMRELGNGHGNNGRTEQFDMKTRVRRSQAA